MPLYRIFRTRSPNGEDIIVGMDRQGRRLTSIPASPALSVTFYGRSTLEERAKVLEKYRQDHKK